MVLRRLLLALLLIGSAAPAQEVKRYVFALVPGTKPDIHTENPVHLLLECPLNHLGMLVRYHYIESGPPPKGALDDAAAVLTWFDSATKEPDWLWGWLMNEVARRDLRVIHFGGWGPLAKKPDKLRAWLAPFGLKWQEYFRKGPYGIAVELRDEKLCAFEADPRRRAIHTGPKSIGKRNRVWITTRETGEDGTVCHPVVTGSWGAVALNPWAIHTGGDDQDRRWHIDPFVFFREALGLARVPAPHPAVLNGRRMWFLQIDGDGFESLSAIRSGSFAAEVTKDEILDRYQLPFTVSVIIRSLSRDLAVEEATPKMKLARAILAMENVEPASHGVLHTLEWQQALRADSAPRTIMWYPKMDNYEYSPVNEVRESIRFINRRLLDGPRRCTVMLWTGQANPLEDAILAASEEGCVNLNGGVFRWDRWHDSLGFVSPWSRRVGKALQVYAGAANENDFDGFFDTMPSAFRHIDQTIQRTGSPRILKPADIYIHFYSAETRARLRSVHTLIKRWALKEPTAPVFASTYARAVMDAVDTARIIRTPDGWQFIAFGGCRSVRIEDEPRDVDLTRSRGILGTRRIGNRLWIHLAAPDANIVLSDRAPRRPYVEEANCLLEETVLGERGVAVTAVAYNPRLVVFAGLPPRTNVEVRVDGVLRTSPTDKDGRVTVRLPEPGKTRIVVWAGGQEKN